MIIGKEKSDVLVFGETNTRKATISQDKMAKLQHLLTKGLYKDPITAVIAEWTNNAIDSVVQAGKDPVKHPVAVQIRSIGNGQWIFSVEDKGTGLDDKTFEEICMNYLESTKEGDNDTIGHFGIGMKSFLSLDRGATFTCRKDGIERKYYCYEGPEFVNYDLLHEKPTKEENGVKAELVINNFQERNQFENKMKTKLAYYDTVVMLLEVIPVQNQIHRHDLFQWSTLRASGDMHIALKDVYYPIDWEALGIPAIPLNVALRFGLGDGLIPTPSRESYITNEATKALIMKRIKEVAEYFITKYNETVKEDTFVNAYPFIKVYSHYVTIGGRNNQVDCLVNYSKIPIKVPVLPYMKIKGIDWYANQMTDVLSEYQLIVDATAKWKSSKFWGGLSNQIISKTKVILCDGVPIGNEREYLKAKYGRFVIVKELRKDTLWGDKEEGYREHSYWLKLSLKGISKDQWRPRIEEWNTFKAELTKDFVDERRLHTKQDFKDWVEKKRAEQKQERLLNKVKGISNGLNKQEGDVTIAYARYNKYATFVTFQKDVFPIASLPKYQYLTVFGSEENREQLEGFFRVCKDKKKIRFAIVGKLEQKKLPQQHFQFIKIQEFMKTKPFQRIASAILFSRLIADFDVINKKKTGVFENCLKQVVADRDLLDKYVKHNMQSADTEVEDAILAAAEEFDSFDKQLWDVYSRLRKSLETYEFITCLAEPDDKTWNDTQRTKYNKLINQILLFRKKYYNDLPKNAVITFEEEEAIPEEQLSLFEEASVTI